MEYQNQEEDSFTENNMIRIRIDRSGVTQSFEQLKKSLMEPSEIGVAMKLISDGVWVRNIKARLNVRTATSGYEAELSTTMKKLDLQFVNRLSGNYSVDAASFGSSAWADRTEAERRAPGGYNRGEITSKIENAIKASEPFKIPDGVAVGIGEFGVLNNLFPGLGVEKQWKLWQILNYGTGNIGAGSGPVIRTGKQIFFNRKTRKGILAYSTINPGFKGREFFVKMDNTMHESDFVVQQYIIRYMGAVVKSLSYRK